MSKRRLNRQQQERIATRQTQKLRRADAVANVENVGDLGPETPGLVICHYGQQLEVESTGPELAGRRFRCHQRSNLPPLVSGDRVVWQANGDASGVVVALTPRHNVFYRPGFGGVLKPVA
ncbi:MAG: ribosome biogenesis GTPase RsgA, partial [Pseudohongiellaceae bacterium]